MDSGVIFFLHLIKKGGSTFFDYDEIILTESAGIHESIKNRSKGFITRYCINHSKNYIISRKLALLKYH